MTVSASLPRAGRPDAKGRRSRTVPVPAAVPVVLVALLFVAIGPRAFLVGSGDTGHYLAAARCVAEHGMCVPHDHWESRFPLTVPMGWSLRLLGEGPAALAVVPLLYALAALTAFATLVERQFGRAAAVLAGTALAASPIVAGRLIEPNVDVAELAWLIAAVLCLQTAHRRDSVRAATAAGVLLGVAVLTRPTALALLPATIGGMALVGRPRLGIAIVAGLCVPLAIASVGHAAWTGDPLLAWRLSLGHAAIPSSELAAGVDRHRSPLLNPAFIGGWRPAMGIRVHWSVDGFLNFVANPEVSITLLAGAVFAMLERRPPAGRAFESRLLAWLAIAAASWFVLLAYGLAVDPKPRMFLPVVAVAATLFGVGAARAWPRRRLLVGTALALIAAKGAIAAVDRPELTREIPVAGSWAAAIPGIAVERRTADYFTLVPAVRERPVFAGQDASRLLVFDEGDCRAAGRKLGLDWRVDRAQAFPGRDPAIVAALRRARFFLQPPITPVLCVLAPDRAPGRAASPPR